MRKMWFTTMASTSLVALSQMAAAQTVERPEQKAAQNDEAKTVSSAEIIVTARRQSESLQNVPQTVNVVSGDAIKKLNFNQFQDLANAVPGLTLSTGSVTAGRAPSPSIRGVSYDASTTPSPTVDIYINDVPTSSDVAFNAIYDIGDVEVLKGPQGTLRGRTAPSGAILMNTKTANTQTLGGYVSGLLGHQRNGNVQGALNIPVVEGILGVRVAGSYDRNEIDSVRSISDPRLPYKDTKSGRISLHFTPTDTFRGDLTYQYTDLASLQWTQVEGAGSAGGVAAAAPAGYNGPAIKASDRLAAGHTPRSVHQQVHSISARSEWDVLGHSVNYVGGYINSANSTISSSDYGNQLPSYNNYTYFNGPTRTWTHEIRVSSKGPNHFIDYSVGYFHQNQNGTFQQTGTASFLRGAFGNPSAPSPFTVNPRYSLPLLVAGYTKLVEDSFYANATLHLGRSTDLTGGGRFIISQYDTRQTVSLGAGYIAQAIPATCSLIGFTASPYAGYCDIPIAAATTPVTDSHVNNTSHPFVFNASLRHRFNDNINGYATVGSSWRRGGTNIGIANSANDPVLNALAYTPNETSTSYEVGFKTTWLDKRLRINASAFYQKFQNLVFQVASIPYIETNGATTTLVANNFTVGANAIVKGFDIDTAFQVNRNWSMSLAASFADGKVNNSLIPCRDSDFDGVADSGTPTLAAFQAHNEAVALCKSNQSVSRDPLWNATFQSEYHQKLSSDSEGYLRGLMNYYPSNSRANAGFTVPEYVMLNLYGGIRSSNGGWDVGIFVKNVTNTGVTLSRDPSLLTTAFDTTFGSSGYRFVTYTPPRQIGVNLRYQFGSR